MKINYRSGFSCALAAIALASLFLMRAKLGGSELESPLAIPSSPAAAERNGEEVVATGEESIARTSAPTLDEAPDFPLELEPSQPVTESEFELRWKVALAEAPGILIEDDASFWDAVLEDLVVEEYPPPGDEERLAKAEEVASMMLISLFEGFAFERWDNVDLVTDYNSDGLKRIISNTPEFAWAKFIPGDTRVVFNVPSRMSPDDPKLDKRNAVGSLWRVAMDRNETPVIVSFQVGVVGKTGHVGKQVLFFSMNDAGELRFGSHIFGGSGPMTFRRDN